MILRFKARAHLCNELCTINLCRGKEPSTNKEENSKHLAILKDVSVSLRHHFFCSTSFWLKTLIGKLVMA